jgi:hypothetical protein
MRLCWASCQNTLLIVTTEQKCLHALRTQMHALRTHKCLHALVLSKSSKHAFNCHYRTKMLTRAYNTNACAQNTQMLACAYAEQVAHAFEWLRWSLHVASSIIKLASSFSTLAYHRAQVKRVGSIVAADIVSHIESVSAEACTWPLQSWRLQAVSQH